jgi:TolA-binding protein
LSDRDDQRLAARLAQEYIARALGRDTSRAALIAQRSLRADPSFRPRSGAQCLRVAELLRLSGDRQSAQTLLRDFADHYPGDAAAADALSMAQALRRD